MNSTVGQILLDRVLPEDMRGQPRSLDKKGMQSLMEELADKHPDDFKKITHQLYQLGHRAAQSKGSSFSLKDLRGPPDTQAKLATLRAQVTAIIEDDRYPIAEREARVQKLVEDATPGLGDGLYEEALKSKNPFALQVLSGSRGDKSQLRSLIGGDFLVADHRDRVIPMPILQSYARGLDPAEYWAGSYGARKGTIATKFATQDAGFFGKQLMQAAHRIVVTEDDCGTERGILVPGNDPDNEGTLLARHEKDYDRDEVVNPRMGKEFGKSDILIRSPVTCQARNGVCKKCAGVRESGGLPDIGDNIGVTASSSLTEKLSQAQLNVKHGGGLAKKDQGLVGFKLINQLAQVPKAFREAAAISDADGVVEMIMDEPQGGKSVMIRGTKHYVPEGFDVLVKPGQLVEAGDLLSEGIPNPAELVKHKGVGAGRRMFVDQFMDAFRRSGMSANRRNIETVARGLINHVRVTDLDGPEGGLPDDIVEYNTLERNYRPRHGFLELPPKRAVGMYLEKPALHYSIGTRITKSVGDTLAKQGIKNIQAHHDDPSFEPEMIPVMRQLSKTPNWQTRLGGSFLQTGLTEAVHRGRSSALKDTSYIPALARGQGFGKNLSTEGVY